MKNLVKPKTPVSGGLDAFEFPLCYTKPVLVLGIVNLLPS